MSKNSKYLNLRGSRTINSPKSDIYEEIRSKSFEFLTFNGYSEIIIPTYDYESVFTSSLGEETDIIQKEMFTFSDKKGRNLALRPEGTACVAKSLVQNNLINSENEFLKLFYWGSMFRYERPQKGRYREFFQLGIELVNLQKISSDCEILYIADSLLKKIKVENYELFLNYLGDENAKISYNNYLKDSLSEKIKFLCSNCKIRFYNNALKIIDCKKCGHFVDLDYEKFLSEEEIVYFEKLKKFLFDMKINFNVDKKLVRGISYYNGLVFEFKKNGENKSIIGGGRYDKLIPKISTFKEKKEYYPAIGFAVGIDRVIDFCKSKRIQEIKKITDILFVSFSEDAFFSSFLLKKEISQRNFKLKVEVMLVDNKSNISKIVSNFNPLFSLFFGEKEIKSGLFSVKNHIKHEHDFEKIILIKKKLLVSWFIEYFDEKKIEENVER